MYYIDKEELEDFIKSSYEEVKDYNIFTKLAAIIFILYQIPLLTIYVVLFVIAELVKKLIQKVKNLYGKNN